MSDSLSKDLKDAIDDVAISLHKGFKKIKSNKKVQEFSKNTSNAFDNLGKEIEKGIDELTGNKKKDTPKQQNNENVDIVNENENPIKEEK